MRLRRNRLPLLLTLVASISAVEGVDKDKNKFSPGPASSFATKQTDNDVTIAAVAYDTEALANTAFGKMNPYAHGVLPVLVVIQNGSPNTVRLTGMKVEYVGPNRERIEATPAKDVRYLRPPQRPNMIPGPGSTVKVLKTKKNPLDAPEIEGRGWAAQLLPAGNSANGFFYFQTPLQRNATIYISGLADAKTGQEILYFEIPMK